MRGDYLEEEVTDASLAGHEGKICGLRRIMDATGGFDVLK